MMSGAGASASRTPLHPLTAAEPIARLATGRRCRAALDVVACPDEARRHVVGRHTSAARGHRALECTAGVGAKNRDNSWVGVHARSSPSGGEAIGLRRPARCPRRARKAASDRRATHQRGRLAFPAPHTITQIGPFQTAPHGLLAELRRDFAHSAIRTPSFGEVPETRIPPKLLNSARPAVLWTRQYPYLTAPGVSWLSILCCPRWRIAHSQRGILKALQQLVLFCSGRRRATGRVRVRARRRDGRVGARRVAPSRRQPQHRSRG